MTFGVDQCRRCGKPIPVAPDAAQRHEQSLRRKPTMTEPQWRAAGWKAAPTAYQMHFTLDGLCKDCKYDLGRRKSRRWRQLGIAAGFIALLFGVVAFVFLVAS